MKVICIEHPTEQDWIACKERALVTMGLKVKNAPTEEWKKSILKARHSPIRRLRFSFYLEDVPTWVMTHLVRHVHAQPYVLSQRNDRQDNYDREKAPQDAPVKAIWDMEAEELMIIMNKRLCKQASEKTRNLVQMMRDEVLKTNPEFEPFLVPMCKYVGECKEMYPCGKKETNAELPKLVTKEERLRNEKGWESAIELYGTPDGRPNR